MNQIRRRRPYAIQEVLGLWYNAFIIVHILDSPSHANVTPLYPHP